MRNLLILLLVALFSGAAAGEVLSPDRFVKYERVRLTSDLSHLSQNQKKMVRHLLAAAKIMDALFWRQAFGDPKALRAHVRQPRLKYYASINYGPWDRLNGDAPFVEGFGPKPLGAGFYPPDMTKEEFEKADFPGKESLYTVVRRDAGGGLVAIPYSQEFRPELELAAKHLRQAADLAQDGGFKKYLSLRAKALLDDKYQPESYAFCTTDVDLCRVRTKLNLRT